jgi:RNA polymerase sigma-70 factor (ECF subfamily)
MPAYDTDPDVQLMLRFQRGDESAFDALVRRHQQSVVNLTFRYVGDPGAAEDLAQDVFVRIYNARAAYRPEAKFTTWLYRIATNLCLNEIRDREKYRPHPLSQSARESEGEGDGTPGALLDRGVAAPPSAGLEREELRRAVAEAVHGLPPQQRMAVILLRWHGCSYQEIAEALDTTVKAVKSLLSRAKENLKSRLERHLGPQA